MPINFHGFYYLKQVSSSLKLILTSKSELLGPLVSAIENATNRKATIIGKPSKFIFDVIVKSNPPFNLERTLMIGDRLDVDVVFGNSCGLKTLFVESGNDKLKTVEEIVAKINEGDEELKKMLPTYTVPHIGDIFKVLSNKM